MHAVEADLRTRDIRYVNPLRGLSRGRLPGEAHVVADHLDVGGVRRQVETVAGRPGDLKPADRYVALVGDVEAVLLARDGDVRTRCRCEGDRRRGGSGTDAHLFRVAAGVDDDRAARRSASGGGADRAEGRALRSRGHIGAARLAVVDVD